MQEEAKNAPDNAVVVEEIPARTVVLPIVVSLPATIFQDADFAEYNDDDKLKAMRQPKRQVPIHDHCLVASVICMPTSLMVWIGWGHKQQTENVTPNISASSTKADSDLSLQVGLAQNLSMGPLLVSMPRTRYQSSSTFSSSSLNETATSKLIGSDSSDDTIMVEEQISRQMSARLSVKLKKAVFASFSVRDAPTSSLLQGIDAEMVHYKAAAIAERTIYERLSEI